VLVEPVHRGEVIVWLCLCPVTMGEKPPEGKERRGGEANSSPGEGRNGGP